MPTVSLPSDPVPVVPPGSGGGLFGGLRAHWQEFPELVSIFGTRMHDGIAPPGTRLPFLVLSIVSARSEYTPASDLQGNVIYLNTWYTTFQVAVYAAGYESARVYAKNIHDHTDRKEIAVDCFLIIPYVSNLIIAQDPKPAEDGREVWHFNYRYEVKLPEFMTEDALPEDALSA